MSVFSSSRNENERVLPHMPYAVSSQTVIAQGVRVEGDFKGQGDVVIDGEVKGNVTTTGVLTVGPQAKVHADIEAESAVIAGSVEGNVRVNSHLEMKGTARIIGDVTCATASIESGATLKGAISMGPQESKGGGQKLNTESEGGQ